jgi:hypothetical protein
MPLKIKLASKIDWPPKGFAFPQAVNAPRGMNWWSLAKMVGRDNPWDLIIFNFQTEDPEEVNFYLQKYVGCREVEANNYIFYGADPGIIYIPPASWRPSTKFKKGSTRRSYSKFLERKVSKIIKKGAHVCPTITYLGLTVTKHHLLKVAKHIEAGDIECFVAPEIRYDNVKAFYDTKNNEFLFSREPRHGNLKDLQWIIHESVHAAFDIRKAKGLYDGTNELFGYAVESVVAAYIDPIEFETELRSLAKKSDHHYYLYFFGWIATQQPGSRFHIDLKTLDKEFDDPFRHTRANPLNNLISTLFFTYGWAKMLTKTPMDGV